MTEARTASDFAKLLESTSEKLNKQKTPSEPSEEVSFPRFSFVEKTSRTETIAYLEQTYYRRGVYPTLTVLNKHLKNEKLPPVDLDFLRADEFSEVLQNRGLPAFAEPTSKSWEQIDYRFQLAVGFLCDFSDKRSHGAKLKEAGLTSREWQGLIRRQNHYNYFTERLEQVWSKDVEPRAKLAIARGIENGDLASVKYFHEYTDRYRPDQAQVMNLTLVISGLLEILAKYVGKEVLQAVAVEMESSGLLQLPKGK
jgi:hypothetical protein